MSSTNDFWLLVKALFLLILGVPGAVLGFVAEVVYAGWLYGGACAADLMEEVVKSAKRVKKD